MRWCPTHASSNQNPGSNGDRGTCGPTCVKWIMCPGCETGKMVQDSARSCSPKCRNRVWRKHHGIVGRRAAICAWCGSPLVYLPQDRLPGMRRYCDDRCAKRARLFARAKERTTVARALNIAVRRLQGSRTPTIVAAAAVLAQFRDELTEHAELKGPTCSCPNRR